MSRFSSLRQVPVETRRILRERFKRNLTDRRHSQTQFNQEEVFDDEVVLQLLSHLTVEKGNSSSRARVAYEQTPGEPTFDELLSAGWLVEVLGRVYTTRDVRLRFLRSAVHSMSSFEKLLKSCNEESYSWTRLSVPDEVENLAKRVTDGGRGVSGIVCRTPTWVAARLWERRFMHGSDVVERITAWHDTSSTLGHLELVPSKVWFTAACDAFIGDALEVLERAASLPTWDEYRERGTTQMAHASGRSLADHGRFIPSVPDTLVGRAVWLMSNVVEPIRYGALEVSGIVSNLVWLLLSEVEHADMATAPHGIAGRLLQLSALHPDILSALLFRVTERPVLVADMLLTPQTSALACLIAFLWSSPPGGWDRELIVRDNEAAKDIAFVDCVSVLSQYLKDEALPPEEVGALLTELHARAKPGNVEEQAASESMLSSLKSILGDQSGQVLRKIYNFLIRDAERLHLGTAQFAAALDILDIGQIDGEIAPEVLPRSYISSIRSAPYTLSAGRISIGGAAALYRQAQKLNIAEQNTFLFPFALRERLRGVAEQDILTVKGDIARALRVHVQILSRIILASPEDASKPLVDALIRTVRTAAISHSEKGRVGAFAATYEVRPFQSMWDRPLTSELAAVLAAIKSTDADRLLAGILETDEPAFLAQLLVAVPRQFRTAVEIRLEGIGPDDAGESLLATEWFLRTDRLLAAGAVSAAKAYMETEEAFPDKFKETHSIVLLRHRLQLALLTEGWDIIEKATVPENIRKVDEDLARETILFYQGTAELKKVGGSPERAQQAFTYLRNRKPNVPEYGFNLFAARVASVLQDGEYRRLRGASLGLARRILADAEQMEKSFDISVPEADAYVTNKALLLLSIGRELDVDRLLRPIYLARMTDRVAAFSAIALSRTGLVDEATTILVQATAKLGESAILADAKRFLSDASTFPAAVQTNDSNNPVPRIAQALSEFRGMDWTLQAEVLNALAGATGRAFQHFVMNEVRLAAASIVSLMPMMTVTDIDGCEDDMNAIVRELLASRLAFVRWSVSDESRGGRTVKGNAGDRDLVIRQDVAELAVLEALVCRYTPRAKTTKNDLAYHFKKLFRYSTCTLYFHLTYAYKGKIVDYIGELKAISKRDVPPGVRYVSAEDFIHEDSRPSGFIARYEGDRGSLMVVFFVLNLAQEEMKLAAMHAEKGRL